MRKLIPFAVALAALVLAAFPATAQDLKIAVVDLDLVVARSPAGQALGTKLESFQKAAKAEVEGLETEAKNLRTRLAEGANTLTQDKLDELQQQYEDKVIAIRRLAESKQREGQKMQTDGLRDIETQLEPVFERVREQNGYDLILNRVPGVVLMVGERIDITEQVIQALGSGS